MIKANKAQLTIDGEIDVVMAEFMCITAYMFETFGAEDVLKMIFGAYGEMKGSKDDEEPPLRNCDSCYHGEWSMPQCRECDIDNAYKYWEPKR